MLLIVGVNPDRALVHLKYIETFADFIQYERQRMSLRIRMRPPRQSEGSPDEWKASRDVGACFFALKGVPPAVAHRYEVTAGHGCLHGATVICWTKNVELPDVSTVPFETGVSLDDFVASSAKGLVVAMRAGFQKLQIELKNPKKKRRINIICDQISSVCLGPAAALGFQALTTAFQNGAADFLGTRGGNTPENATVRQVAPTMQELPKDFH